jgi:hypothetical protein
VAPVGTFTAEVATGKRRDLTGLFGTSEIL